MPTTKTIEVFIQASAESRSNGVLHQQSYTTKERFIRAIMILILLWILALGSVFIIFAHWVLVPGFFIAGPIFAYRKFRLQVSNEHICGICPRCNKEIKINLEAKEALPKWSYCPRCEGSIQVIEKTNSLNNNNTA